MSKISINTILFDADGVVIKNHEFFSARYARENNIPADYLETFFRHEWSDIIIGKADLKEQLEYYLPKWNWHRSVNEFLDTWFASENNLDFELITHIMELRRLGIECHLATNQEKYRLKYMKKQMKLGKVFEKVYSSGEIGVRKPNVEYFEHIWEDLGRPDKRSIVFLDDQRKNVLSARKFGINAYVYSNIENYKQILDELGVRL